MNIAEAIAEVRARFDAVEARQITYTDHMMAATAALLENSERALAQEQLRHVTDAGNSSAAGALDLSLGGPARGSAWIIQRLTATGGNAGTVSVYLDEVDPRNLIDERALATRGAWDEGAGIYVPEGRTIVIHFLAQGAAQYCSVRVQVKELNRGD